MLGRGVDMILEFPGNPTIYESAVKDAKEYVYLIQKRLLAEEKRSLSSPPAFWKHLLPWIQNKNHIHYFCCNLETAITTSLIPWKDKAIHYKMSPQNSYILKKLQTDLYPKELLVSLANNHVIDWGRKGLCDTLNVLRRLGISWVGAGKNRTEACTPIVRKLSPSDSKNCVVFGCAHESSGVPTEWAATDTKSGVFFAPRSF